MVKKKEDETVVKKVDDEDELNEDEKWENLNVLIKERDKLKIQIEDIEDTNKGDGQGDDNIFNNNTYERACFRLDILQLKIEKMQEEKENDERERRDKRERRKTKSKSGTEKENETDDGGFINFQ